jgi:hypothetical protein
MQRRAILHGILLAPTNLRFYGGDDGAGGGNGGSGNGSGNPSGSEQPVGLTEDAQKQVNELINKALGPRLKIFEDKLTKASEASNAKLLESFSNTLSEQLSALKPDEGKEGKGKPAATDLSQNPEFRALQKQNAEVLKQLEAEKQEKQKANAKARNEALNRKVESELAALGIADPRSARLILQGDDVVSYEDDDSETVVFKDEEGGALPLKKGLESWAKSAVGKRFMPPSGSSGSGERQTRNGAKLSSGTPNGLPSTSEIGQALSSLLDVPLV